MSANAWGQVTLVLPYFDHDNFLEDCVKKGFEPQQVIARASWRHAGVFLICSQQKGSFVLEGLIEVTAALAFKGVCVV